MKTYTIKIFRSTRPQTAPARLQRYSFTPQDESVTVLDCLNELHDCQDSTLTFRKSCRSGICGSCAMNINGKNRLACETLLSQFCRRTINLRPLPYFPLIRDLVVDMEPFFEALIALKPFIMRSDSTATNNQESLQTQQCRALIDEGSQCIHCGSCTSSCPSFWYNAHFFGPAALLKVYRNCVDSRDAALTRRLDSIASENGIWTCQSIFNCVEACPKSLNPALAIQRLRVKSLKVWSHKELRL
ncbi:MAG: succinate dehydrogenase iron-sulfur subunit [Chitinivibrionales bacterium]|nr:succinate dehydrogenase iron-sulfur subunit [Chitinivibrionales bacterium]